MNKNIEYSIIIIIITIGCAGIFASQGLYADGSYFLLNILYSKGYWLDDKPRLLIQLITQGPVVMAINLGIIEINKIIYIHSFGLIGIPILVYVLSLTLHLNSRHFSILLMSFSTTYLTSGFFSISECNLTYALVTLCFAIMVKDSVSFFLKIGLIFSAVILVRSYEAMIFLGPVLCTIAGNKLMEKKINKTLREEIYLIISFFLFAASSVNSFISIINPRDSGNLANALNAQVVLVNLHFFYLFSMVTLFMVSHSLHESGKRYVKVISIILSIIYISNQSAWVSPTMSYYFRSASGLFLGGLFLFYQFTQPPNQFKPIKIMSLTFFNLPSKIVPTMLFISLAIPTLITTYAFYFYIKKFQAIAIALIFWIPIDEAFSHENGFRDKFDWTWTNPSLSVILRGNNRAGILNRIDYNGWNPDIKKYN